MELFVARVFDGLTSGAGYAALALALVLIYKATTLVNFAQGELALAGAFIAYSLNDWGLPVVVAVVAAMILTAVLAAVLERTLVRPFDPADHLPLVIITLGLFLAINAGIVILWGTVQRQMPTMFPDGNVITYGIASLTWTSLGTMASVLIIFFGLTLLLNKTKIGLAFRAVSSNLESSELVGIKVGSTLQFGWALAAAVGTLGACLALAGDSFDFGTMQRTLVFAFAAAALGGLDSLGGAIIGGFAVGLIRSLLVGYVDFVPSQMSLATAVVVILVVLLFRPSGLFGSHKVVRV